MSHQELLLGDDAVGLGALHAGLSGVYGYPGTPSTEIFEYVEGRAAEFGVHARWSANEKVGYEEALGMSFAGRRALVTMKHVGLNVAADPFMNSALTGVGGGLVLAVADDPGMHSSQNEQDSRVLAAFAQIPVLEPRDQQEAYDMTREAFEVSERFGVPVMVRLVTRLSHSRAAVRTRPALPQRPLALVARPDAWTLLPANARVRYAGLVARQPAMRQWAEGSPFQLLDLDRPDPSLGVIATGIGFNYFLEAVGGESPYPFLKIGAYPTPAGLVRRLVDRCEQILVVEDGYPFVEQALRGLLDEHGDRIHGRLDGRLNRTGELNPDLVASALGRPVPAGTPAPLDPLPGRPPQLCPGCPHADAFRAINEALAGFRDSIVTSDIGCYTLGFYQPYSTIQTCVDMGASISMASGAAHAGAFPVLCVIGDSTFAHSGMGPLLGAAR
ncbi:MAG: indolepyruvate ferredoxin oxidoreductase, partial [Deltaproteobacteria bacterium]|nr:indolepyruvate ferredoxin oxidoreductase [Deltaproteobacteria bacterium]